MNMGLALWLILKFAFFLVFCIFEILGSFFWYFVFLFFLVRFFVVFCIFEKLHSYYFFIFSYFWYFVCQNTKKKNKINTNKYTLYFCIFCMFHYFQKCTLYFCIFPFLHRLHFVLSYFPFFRHAVKEQNRKSTNVCCISLLLLILPPSVLYLFGNLGLYFFVCFFLYF